MEVDEIQRQVCKFQRVSSNGSTTTTDNSSNPQKIATHKGNLELQNHVDDGGGGIDVVVGGGGGGGIARLCGWPSSRIVRVSRASGGKDRHSKVLTSKGLRDRRVRLSVSTAIQFYDLQDRLGYDQPSKAVEWLLKAASTSIEELPSLDPSFPGAISHNHHHHHHQQQLSEEKKSTGNSTDFEDPNYQQQNSNNNNVYQAKSPACSSTSETSKGSGLSLSRSENRVKARERAREMASKKDKDKETVLNQVNNISENSSFTDLLTGGINSTTVRRPNPTASPDSRAHWTTPMDYFFSRPPQPSSQLIQMPQFNITAGDTHHHHHNNNQQHHFSFLQDSFVPAVTTAGSSGGGGESYNLNFSMTSSSGGGGALAPGFSRGTLQSNLPSSLLSHHHHHHHIQRFQSSSIDGSTPTNLPFFIVPNAASDNFPATGSYDSQGLHLSYGGGGDGVGRNSDHHKEKAKN